MAYDNERCTLLDGKYFKVICIDEMMQLRQNANYVQRNVHTFEAMTNSMA